MTKISNFFAIENVLVNCKKPTELTDNKVLVYNANYTAARLDLLKFTLKDEIEVVGWFYDEETANAEGLHERSPHRKALAVLFRPVHFTAAQAYELIKSKLLGTNTIKLSLNELILDNDQDKPALYVSFKPNINMEKNRIGIKTNGKFKWQYVDGVKAIPAEKKPPFKGSKNKFENKSNKNSWRGRK